MKLPELGKCKLSRSVPRPHVDPGSRWEQLVPEVVLPEPDPELGQLVDQQVLPSLLYLAEKLEPSGRSGGRSPYSESYYAGWIWCSGTSVKAVDFIHYDEKNNEWNLLQVKNRDNTENSSSSKIRDNTTIKKWFRTYSQRDATNWDNFPDEVSSKNLNEEDFRAFVKNYLAKII